MTQKQKETIAKLKDSIYTYKCMLEVQKEMIIGLQQALKRSQDKHVSTLFKLADAKGILIQDFVH